METQAQISQLLQALVANQTLARSPRRNEGMTVESRHLRDFQKYNPWSLDGGKIDPVAAEASLEATEIAFNYMN